MKKYKRMTLEDRIRIEAYLTQNKSLSYIAKQLNYNVSTISREVNNHLKVTNGKPPSKDVCKRNYCNGCKKKYFCHFQKQYYLYDEAMNTSNKVKSISRQHPKLDIEDIKVIDSVVKEGVDLGQSLHHIYVSNPILSKICCERTIRRLCYRGNLETKPHELRKYVVYKKQYKYSDVKRDQYRDITVLLGRSFSDFNRVKARNKSLNIAQFDSVIGLINDKQAILTITFPKYNFQFGLLIKKSDPKSVNHELKKLFKKIGANLVQKVFPLCLADNGVEFTYFHELELDSDNKQRLRTFFTNPYQSWNKSECERCHEFIRYFIPKKKSMDFLTQETLNYMFSNINSYTRKSLNDNTPYDLVKKAFGEEFLNLINIKRINKKRVKLTALV